MIFFITIPLNILEEKWGLVNPFNDCKLYKVKGKFIKTSFCEYKAYHRKVLTKDLKKQLMIDQMYFSESDTTDVYLFYKLISKEGIVLKIKHKPCL
jgi:ATP-dependent DNA ligase